MLAKPVHLNYVRCVVERAGWTWPLTLEVAGTYETGVVVAILRAKEVVKFSEDTAEVALLLARSKALMNSNAAQPLRDEM